MRRASTRLRGNRKFRRRRMTACQPRRSKGTGSLITRWKSSVGYERVVASLFRRAQVVSNRLEITLVYLGSPSVTQRRLPKPCSGRRCGSWPRKAPGVRKSPEVTPATLRWLGQVARSRSRVSLGHLRPGTSARKPYSGFHMRWVRLGGLPAFILLYATLYAAFGVASPFSALFRSPRHKRERARRFARARHPWCDWSPVP